MKLLNSFYYIDRSNETTTGFAFDISLNKEHLIYKAHFPEKPITPGVCIIQIAEELIELQMQRHCFLKKVTNVKYLSVLSPKENKSVTFGFSKIVEDEEGLKAHVLIENESGAFAKLSLVFSYDRI
jgi:3-hydroxyacyl-[acyl-carrier-protein] dehydratase